MVEPISAGALVVAALSIGATAFAKGALGQAGKEAYQALKNAVLGIAPQDAEELEKKPDAKGRQAALSERIDEQSQDEQTRLAELAKLAAKAFRQEAEAGRPIGVDIRHLKAIEEVELGNITTTEGIGFKADTIETKKFSIADINTGKGSSGKR